VGFFSYGPKGTQLQVVVCESRSDAPDNVPFRLVSDPDNVIRINQEYTVPSSKSWDVVDEEWNVEVVGTSYRVETVLGFIAGESRQIQLVRAPMPRYAHAIAVYGEWVNKKGKPERAQLGYLPNDYAKTISKEMAEHGDYVLVAKIWTMFIPTQEKENPGLRIDVQILEPAWPRFEVHGVSRDTGRKRKRTYRAKDKEEAILQAQKDGIIVEVGKIKQL
jgi:hypothetical protein